MYPKSLEKLITCFRTLPGVGEKTAERYALLIAEQDELEVMDFARALQEVKEKLTHCHICGNLSDESECEICRDTSRDKKMILVVQSPKDVVAMERTNEYHGVYHVLNGLISSSKGIMPEDLNIVSLLNRSKEASEVILATNATVDGETTALYLSKLLGKECPNVTVTRIAHGLSSGLMIDYADEMTLIHALTDRRKV